MNRGTTSPSPPRAQTSNSHEGRISLHSGNSWAVLDRAGPLVTLQSLQLTPQVPPLPPPLPAGQADTNAAFLYVGATTHELRCKSTQTTCAVPIAIEWTPLAGCGVFCRVQQYARAACVPTQAAITAGRAPPQLDDLPDHLLAAVLTLATAPLRAAPLQSAEATLRVWSGYCHVSRRWPPPTPLVHVCSGRCRRCY